MAQTASPISCPSLEQDLVIRRGKPNAPATAMNHVGVFPSPASNFDGSYLSD